MELIRNAPRRARLCLARAMDMLAQSSLNVGQWEWHRRLTDFNPPRPVLLYSMAYDIQTAPGRSMAHIICANKACRRELVITEAAFKELTGDVPTERLKLVMRCTACNKRGVVLLWVWHVEVGPDRYEYIPKDTKPPTRMEDGGGN